MPLCLSSLRHLLRRVNYPVAQWKRSDEPHPALPSQTEHGWCLSNGVLEPVWCDEEIVPQSLVDLLAEDCDENNNEYHVIDNNLSHCDSDLESEQHRCESSDDSDYDDVWCVDPQSIVHIICVFKGILITQRNKREKYTNYAPIKKIFYCICKSESNDGYMPIRIFGFRIQR